MKKFPLIGVSACFDHADFKRPIFKGKIILYTEESMLHWILSESAYPVLIPTLPVKTPFSIQELVSPLSGLILQGGADVSPETYGEQPLNPEWKGDSLRDRYEIALIKEF